MERRQILKSIGFAASTGVTSLAGCSSPKSGSDDGTQTKTSTKGAKGSTKTIQMITKGNNYYFDPIGLFVEPGTVITWKVKSGSHSATAYKKGNGSASVTRIPNGAESWNSNILSKQGATFNYRFDKTGTYDYFCIPHKSLGMVARIVVGKPGGPAEGSMPPDGKLPKSQTIVDQGAVSYDEFSK